MLYLYTETFHIGPKFKRVVKKILGREIRGPQAVEKSLIAGLKQNYSPFQLNAPLIKAIVTAGVLSDAQTLRWAISQKEKGLIKYIVAGPNIAISPNDNSGIWRNPLNDVVIVPSQWVKEHYISEAPELAQKIRIWPAGVQIPGRPKTQKIFDFLIYNKIGSSKLFVKITEFLKSAALSFNVLDYGKFKQADYFKLLEESKYLIYLSESESQGLAMFEAWARNVPVFAWDRGFWQKGNFRQTGFTATPYLSSQSGERFRDLEEFKANIQSFMHKIFNPKVYVEENFSDMESAKKYLEIIRELEN